jgi:hypothetical protein
MGFIAAAYASVYSICLKDYLGQINGGWMVWVLAGSYYIREGVVNSDETWGKFSLFEVSFSLTIMHRTFKS